VKNAGRRVVGEELEHASEGSHLLAHGDGPRAEGERALRRPALEPGQVVDDRLPEGRGIADVQQRRHLAFRHRPERSRRFGGC
jgi:hypothetical protein